jgi:hypothetical protein
MSNKKISEKVALFYDKVHEESFAETKDKKFWFLFFTGLVSILFFVLFALVGKNPYSLLLPLTLHDSFLPVYDKRTKVKVFFSDGQMNAFPVERKISLSGELRKDIKLLLIETSEPPYFGTEEQNSVPKMNLKKLPGLHFALIQTWVLSNNTLVLDFREETLLLETTNLKVRIDKGTYDIQEETKDGGRLAKEKEEEDKNKVALEKLRLALLDSAFVAIEKTIFENFSTIQTIEFRVDGKKKDLPGMEYKLSTKRTKS